MVVGMLAEYILNKSIASFKLLATRADPFLWQFLQLVHSCIGLVGSLLGRPASRDRLIDWIWLGRSRQASSGDRSGNGAAGCDGE